MMYRDITTSNESMRPRREYEVLYNNLLVKRLNQFEKWNGKGTSHF